jgi:hypothetical protein
MGLGRSQLVHRRVAHDKNTASGVILFCVILPFNPILLCIYHSSEYGTEWHSADCHLAKCCGVAAARLDWLTFVIIGSKTFKNQICQKNKQKIKN